MKKSTLDFLELLDEEGKRELCTELTRQGYNKLHGFHEAQYSQMFKELETHLGLYAERCRTIELRKVEIVFHPNLIENGPGSFQIFTDSTDSSLEGLLRDPMTQYIKPDMYYVVFDLKFRGELKDG